MPFPIEAILATKDIRAQLAISEIEEDLVRGDAPLNAANAGYIAFMDVNADPCFRSVVESMERTVIDQRREIDRLLADRHSFNQLLEDEAYLLALAGADVELVDILVQEIKERHNRQEIQLLVAAELYRSLLEFQVQLNQIQSDLLENKELHKPARRGWRQKLADAVVGLGGVALVGLNASALAATLGFGAPGSAVSATIGGTLVGHSLKTFLARPAD